MQSSEDEDDRMYNVVMNDEQQYSIWPDGKNLPSGWLKIGTTGHQAECLRHIESVWTDMRPLSVRRAMAKPDPQ